MNSHRHKTNLRNRGLRAGFTLIELLVVIAIISLLVSILIPSLQKAKDIAKLTICATQLRTLGMAINTYAEENEGNYVPNPKNDYKSPENVHRFEFVGRLRERYDCPPSVFYCPFKTADTYKNLGYTTEDGIVLDWWSPQYYAEIGYPYLACYDAIYDPWFLNGYHSPQTLDKSESSWVLMTDQTRMWASQTNHWFDGENVSANVLYVDMHVELHSENLKVNFDAGGGFWIWW